MRRTLTLVQLALTDFSRNNCPYMAAGIAYWTLFSLFPLTLAGISILGFLFPKPAEQRDLVQGIVKLVPVSEGYLTNVIDEVVGARGTIGVLAIIGLLWSGTAVFSAMRKGINHAWHIGQPPHFLWERAIDLIMLLGLALLAFMVVVFTTNLLGLSTAAQGPAWLAGGLAGKVLLELAALAVTFGLFLLMYRYVPNAKVTWGDVWLGALTGAVLFQGVRIGFTWFVASFGNFNLVYGSLGALMAVLLWAYLSAISLMWGAQVGYTYSRTFGARAAEGILSGLQQAPAAAPGQHGFLGMVAAVARRLLPPKRNPL